MAEFEICTAARHEDSCAPASRPTPTTMSALFRSLPRAISSVPRRRFRSITTTATRIHDDDAALVDDISPDYPPQAPPSGYPNPFQKAASSEIRYTKVDKPLWAFNVRASPNNCIMNLTKNDGTMLCQFSGGSCGFKGANRSGYEAGYQCTIKIFEVVKAEAKKDDFNIEIIMKGRGQAREALITALKMAEGEAVRPRVVQLTDRTPIKIGGTRAKKARRL
ncbi:hypothetical protein PLICRDRAFT_232052 [Plicaturopsis crispa FD-325 SS-3]|nr:hypothetical protein PLICRDRAFT_232052 [Plicaturopsis crispa FD-325 SS-3]